MTGPTNGEMGLTQKDVGITSPKKEGLTKFGGSVSLNAFSMAVDNGGIKPKDKDFELDYKKILEVARSFPPESFQTPDPFSLYSAATELEKLDVPDGYNLEDRTRRNVREVVKLYQDSGIVDQEVLVQGGKFAGPGNIDFQATRHGNPAGAFDMSKHYMNLPKGTDLVDTWIPPAPASKKERDENIKLAMHKDVIAYYAFEVTQVSSDNGIDLTPEQAFDIGAQQLAIHEMGHVYDAAVGSLGGSTFSKAWYIPDDSLEGIVRKWSVNVHMEHLARGLENTLLPTAIEKITGMESKSAEKLAQEIGNWELLVEDQRKMLLDFFTQNLENSVSPFMVFDIEDRLSKDVVDMDTHGDQEMSGELTGVLPYSFGPTAYKLKPYTPDEVGYIMNRGDAAIK